MTPFEKTMLAEIDSLRKFARVLTRTRKHDYEDLVQDTLMRAITKKHLFAEGTNMRAWLMSIMHNTNINQVRTATRRGTLSLEKGMDNIATLPSQEKVVELKECASELTKLSPEHRQAIMLIGIEGMRYDDAAQVLSIPIGTVRSRLSRGRDELRAKMDKTVSPYRRHNYPEQRKGYAHG